MAIDVKNLLLIFIIFFSCESHNGGNEDEAAKKSKEFNYPKDEAVEYIEEWVDSLELHIDLPDINESKFARELYMFYRGRYFFPSWNNNSFSELLTILENIENEGLDPADFPLDELRSLRREVMEYEDPEAGARLDILLSATYMKLADIMATGIIKADKISDSWHIRPQAPDTLYRHLDVAVDNNLTASLEYFKPQFMQYAKLQSFISTYAGIAEKGGWPEIMAGGVLQPGDSGEQVLAVRERLYLSNDLKLPPSKWENPLTYDTSLIAAVNNFQERHGLAVQPEITKRMISAMNVPAEVRLKQIKLNMDRIRWFSSGKMPETYVLVNIPEYSLRVFEEGREIKYMRVVVGKVMNTTPIFSDMIEYAVFAPYWNVPESIAKNEIWPLAEKDSTYLERNHYEVLDGWGPNARIIPPDQIHWHNLENYRIRQKPGPWNALGKVKFMFPNDFSIYLHDTPQQKLFNLSDRAFSHGCIRIEEPEWFADWLFPQYNLQDIKRKMNSGKRDVVGLKNKVPVYIFYLTAFVDEKGRLNFREDLYRLDKRLMDLL